MDIKVALASSVLVLVRGGIHRHHPTKRPLRKVSMESDSAPPRTTSDLAAIAAARRVELAQNYLTGSTVQSLLGIDASTLTAWRKERRLLAVWHKPDMQWIYPDFQFDRTGLIYQMPELLTVYDRYYSHVWDNPWRVVEWFMSPHLLLDGARPCEILALDPQRVLSVAQNEFLDDPMTLW